MSNAPASELITLTLLTTARHLSRDARMNVLLDTAIEHGQQLAAAAGAAPDQIAAAVIGYDTAPQEDRPVRGICDFCGRAYLPPRCPVCYVDEGQDDEGEDTAPERVDPDHVTAIVRDREYGL
ncbi:hypothetical protein [Nocardia salmonicida]|uniref:hypothetical protein n=1 Tax=Nocardia salmonicida TaxID=53431 RepID=UPI00362870B4